MGRVPAKNEWLDLWPYLTLPEQDELQQLLEQEAMEAAREDLIAFAQYIDPNAAYWYRARHLRQIANELMAAVRGECDRLMIFMPPRHWKSSLVSEKFPMWYLGNHPESSVIIASYALDLAEGFSRNIRNTIKDNPYYHTLFPKVRLRADTTGAAAWSLVGAPRFSLRAVGVGGGVTGHGGKVILIDDPIANHEEAYSKAQRDKLYDWYQSTLRTRAEPNAVMVLVMTRWHSDDLAGRLLKAMRDGEGESWKVLHLPALNEQGEALWPERYDASALLRIKQAVGPRAWAAEYQGTPRPDEGALLDSSKLIRINAEEIPELVRVCRRWDLAFSETKGSDYVAGAKVGVDARQNRYILHIRRFRGEWPKARPIIIETAHADGPGVICAIEANGTQLGYFQDIRHDPRMASFLVLKDRPEGTKEMRAALWGSRLDEGKTYVVRGEWNQAFFDEMDAFPTGEKDDQVDAVSGAMAIVTDDRRSFVYSYP